MALLTLRDVDVSFGAAPLLDGAALSIEAGERIALVGRNGTGKSTLLKVLAGELTPDDGEVNARQGLKVVRLEQEVPRGLDGSVFDVVLSGLPEHGRLLAEYHDLSRRVAEPGGEALLARLESIQHELEAVGGWLLHQRVDSVLSRLALPADTAFASLSGGLKRRVLLGRALVADPDLLLLDEPTNHLDIEAIVWLEELLGGFPGSVLFITHDRAFLRRLATRIIELDRGRLTSWPGDYPTYLRRKEEALNAESQEQARFDKRLAQEEVWIRQGIKARRTRNEGRVRALEAMREERRVRRERIGNVHMRAQEAERSGKLVIEAEGIGYAWDGKPVLRDFSTTILRGDKIGVVGPNGVGKTTLLRLLLGDLEPQSGRVRHGTRLEVAYFDQLRSQLRDDASVAENVGEGRDTVDTAAGPRHVIGYLQEFLFSPERAHSPVRALSGGERNRLLLAKLFTRPSNVLVLDEPTNDLDVETLELLESLLLDYGGTMLLVSHDREFLDNVVTGVLAFEGDGVVNEYVGGYRDWLRQRPAPAPEPSAAPKTDKPAPARRERSRTKLGYKEQRELESLPGRIEALEEELEALQARMGDPAFYRGEAREITAAGARLEALEGELADAYQRWEVLEELGG